MHFAIQYPQAPAGFRSSTGFCKSESKLECCQCGERTAWFHLAKLLYFCSDQCYWRYVNGTKHSHREITR